MMNFSIIIGSLHIAAAILAGHLFAANPPPTPWSLGWLLIIGSGLALYLTSISWPDAVWLRDSSYIGLAAGILLLLLCSKIKKWRKSSLKEKVLCLANGFINLTGISKLFGDILSYLRLFALGLASAQLAVTFNALAMDSFNIAGIGTLAAVLILCFGHSLNLLLGIMSGFVHGLRLNYIEFFNWGLAEEGTPFKPFARRRINLWNQL